MKIDLTSLSFNSNLINGVGTPSWGTALGQKEGYDITVDGASDILLGMYNNIVDSSNFETNFKSEKDILITSHFKKVYVNEHRIASSLLLALVVEHSPSHDGRKSLKYNDKFRYTSDGVTISNEQFYNEVQEFFGPTACWFAYEINVVNGKELHIKAIKVSDENVTYSDSKKRKEEWASLIEFYSDSYSHKLIRNTIIGKFVFDVLSFLNNSKEIDKLFPYMSINKDDRYCSIEKDGKRLTSIFWVFVNKPEKSELSMGGKIRAFEDHSVESQGIRYYLSKEWTDQIGHRLDINVFIDIFNSIYKKYSITKESSGYVLNLLRPLPEIVDDFHGFCESTGLLFSKDLLKRYISSLIAKPFVILTGLSGSGKTKLAHAFAKWLCEDERQYCLVPVGADWTNREPLLGFPNALEPTTYIKPDNNVLDLILRAQKNPFKPYFLLLDEMNLSHVERYFADFLSAMESNDKIYLHEGENDWEGVPSMISLPRNLFVIGTVNIDETTYMFSPKVLDRASTIEFRVTKDEMISYLEKSRLADYEDISGLGAAYGCEIIKTARQKLDSHVDVDSLNEALIEFFEQLKVLGAEFGYRTAREILRFAQVMIKLCPEVDINVIIDYAILQKLLPKVHGSKRKLDSVLKELIALCLNEKVNLSIYTTGKMQVDLSNTSNIKYPFSLEKIVRMYNNLAHNGFTSFAEA